MPLTIFSKNSIINGFFCIYIYFLHFIISLFHVSFYDTNFNAQNQLPRSVLLLLLKIWRNVIIVAFFQNTYERLLLKKLYPINKRRKNDSMLVYVSRSSHQKCSSVIFDKLPNFPFTTSIVKRDYW